jgi:hypothetical protein
MSNSKYTNKNTFPEKMALIALRSAIENLETAEKGLVEADSHQELRSSLELARHQFECLKKDFSTALVLLREAHRELPKGELKEKVGHQVNYIWERRL